MDLLDQLQLDIQNNYRIFSITSKTNLFRYTEDIFKLFRNNHRYNTFVIMDSTSANYTFFDYAARKYTGSVSENQNDSSIKVLSSEKQAYNQTKAFRSMEESSVKPFLSIHPFHSFQIKDPFIRRYTIEYQGKPMTIYHIDYNAPIVFLLLQQILNSKE